MSKQISLFARMKRFVNIHPVGQRYTTDHLYQNVGIYEESSWWKVVNHHRQYRTSTYQTYLKRLGYLKKIKRGLWEVRKHVPESLTSSEVNRLLGYKPTSSKSSTSKKDNVMGFRLGDAVTYAGQRARIAGFNCDSGTCVIEYAGDVTNSHRGTAPSYWHDEKMQPIPYVPGTRYYFVPLKALVKVAAKPKDSTRNGFKIGDHVEYVNKHTARILGFGKSGGTCVIEFDDYPYVTHAGMDPDYWYDEDGNKIPYVPGEKRYYVLLSNLKKIKKPKTPKMKQTKYQVGDIVRVKENGNTYSTYTSKFKELGFKNKKINDALDNGSVAKVFAVTEHESNGEMLYAIIGECGKESLISEKGIEKISFEYKRQLVIGSHKVTLTKEKLNVGCNAIDREEFKYLVEKALECGFIKL